MKIGLSLEILSHSTIMILILRRQPYESMKSTQVRLTNDGDYLAIKSKFWCRNNEYWEVTSFPKYCFLVKFGSDISGQIVMEHIDIEKDNNGFLTLAASGTNGTTDAYVYVYKLINSGGFHLIKILLTNHFLLIL